MTPTEEIAILDQIIADRDATIKELVEALAGRVYACEACEDGETYGHGDSGRERYPCPECSEDRALIARAAKEIG